MDWSPPNRPPLRPAGFMEPCIPTLSDKPPVGVFRHACKLGLEGIVSKRRDSLYESGRSKSWLRVKNPDSPAAQRLVDVTR